MTCDDPLVDLALVEALTVRWTLDSVELHVDVPVGDVLSDGSTSFVLQMPGGVTVTALTAQGTGPGGAVIATATVDAVEVPRSGTRDVALALGSPAGPQPLACTGGGAPAPWPTVRVTDAPEYSKTNSVAWMDTGWVVGFNDARFNDPEKSRTDPMIALLAPDGTKLADEIRVDDGWCYASDVRVAWTGSRLAVAWYDCSPSSDGNNYDLEFRAFDPSGTPLGSTKVLTQAVANNENWRTGSLLWDGSRLVLSAARLTGDGPDWDQFVFLRDQDGDLIEEPILLDSVAMTGDQGPRLALSGGGFAIVYEYVEANYTQTRAWVLSPGGHAVGGAIELGQGGTPDITWAGDRYVVTQVDRSGPTPQVRLTPIGADGSLGAPLVLPLSSGSVPTYVASDGSDLGLAVPYSSSTPSTNGLAFQRHAVWLAPLEAPTALRDGEGSVSLAAIGAGPGGYGIAWTDDSAGNAEVWFAAFGCQ